MNTVIIGIGSNISPRKNISQATRLLNQKVAVLAKSKFIKTRPIGLVGAKDFLNGAVLVKTALSRVALRKALKVIEHELGRPRYHNKNESRTIDLDILVFNRKMVDPDIRSREFLRQAITELDPTLLKKQKSKRKSD